MATPKFVVAGTTAFKEVNMNRALISDGTKVQVKVYHAHIRYNGASWEVVAATTDDNAGIVTGDLAFDDASDTLRITLSGFVNPPIGVGTPHNVDAAYNIKMGANSNVRMDVKFYAISGGALITTNSDTNMDFNIIIIGY
jgi:hypothetical protein